MQRRAAAAYIALFLVVGAVSFSLIATASTPEFSVENPEYTLEANESFTVDGTEYTVQSIDAEMSGGGGGGHGGGGAATLERSAVIGWTNESAQFTRELSNDSTVAYENRSWNVSIRGNASQVAFVEVLNRSSILQNDSSVANQTTTVDGEEYVVRQENGTRTLVPAEEYFPASETREFDQGDQFEYNGNETTVASVANETATLEWTAVQENQVEVGDNANVSLGSTTYFAHFPDNSTLELTTDHSQYRAFQDETTRHTDHTNGLWGVTILSGLSVIFLGGLAYLPSRY